MYFHEELENSSEIQQYNRIIKNKQIQRTKKIVWMKIVLQTKQIIIINYQ